LHGDSNMPAITISQEFALEVQEFNNRNEDAFALLFEGSNLYILTASERAQLRAYPGVLTRNTEASFVLYDARSAVEMQFSEITPALSLYVDEMPASRSNDFMRLDVPFVPQGSHNLCWAASAVSKGYFVTGRSMTPTALAETMNIPFHTGASTLQTNQAFRLAFGQMTTAHGFAPTPMAVVNKIRNRQRPMIITLHNTNLTLAHIVLFNGFHTSSQGIILHYMDPNFGFATTFAPTEVTIPHGGLVLRAIAHIS